MEPGASSPDNSSPIINTAMDIGCPSNSSSSDINPKTRSKWKTPLFALVVIFTNAFGNFFIARGMRALPAVGNPADLIIAIFTPWVGLGIALLITWLLSRMMFLSFADLSFMLPLTSLGYVLSVVLGHAFLNEQITAQRWIGTGFIMIGTILVGTGNVETTHHAAGPADAAAEVAEEILHASDHASEHANAASAAREAGVDYSGIKPGVNPGVNQ